MGSLLNKRNIDESPNPNQVVSGKSASKSTFFLALLHPLPHADVMSQSSFPIHNDRMGLGIKLVPPERSYHPWVIHKVSSCKEHT